jgi:hypothetical protein
MFLSVDKQERTTTMINIQKFNAIVEAAKAKAANDPKWLRAIERAAREILSGEMVVSLFADNTALVTTPNGQYRVNGVCFCKAAQNGHTQCAHRAGKRLMATYEETAAKLERTRERSAANLAHDRVNMRRTAERAARYCGDRDLQHLDRCKPHVTLADDVAASSRQNLIVEIKAAWPKSWPPLYSELLARFGKSELEMLDDDSLRRVRLAVAM